MFKELWKTIFGRPHQCDWCGKWFRFIPRRVCGMKVCKGCAGEIAERYSR